MSAGCFSSLRLRKWGAKKSTMEAKVSRDSCCATSLTKSYVQKRKLGMGAAEPESEEVSRLIHVLWTLTRICLQALFENTRTVVPTTKEYIMATGKQALALLESAASAIPVPLLQDAIGIAIKIIEVCEVRGICMSVLQVAIRYAYIRRHQLSSKRSKSYRRGSCIS